MAKKSTGSSNGAGADAELGPKKLSRKTFDEELQRLQRLPQIFAGSRDGCILPWRFFGGLNLSSAGRKCLSSAS